jgi:hypothetical protein
MKSHDDPFLKPARDKKHEGEGEEPSERKRSTRSSKRERGKTWKRRTEKFLNFHGFQD